MKISDITHKTFKEVAIMPRFDLEKPPIKAKWYLQLLAWILSFPETFQVKSKIKKIRMTGVKGPYILLCNHNSFLDFKVATRAIFPRRSTYIVAIDGFINREWLLRNVGGIGKRKFISDPFTFRQVKYTLEKLNQICQIYPEARYSLVGTQSDLPDSLGKLVKVLKYPVVTLISHGHHLRQPFWNLKKRKVQTYSELNQILTADEVKEKSVDEINHIIRENIVYDDYQYQLDSKIEINDENRAKGLHKPLFMCPHCLHEHTMRSNQNKLWCSNCDIVYEMDSFGQLQCMNSDTKFHHIPDWFEWQRKQVRKEIENGSYNVELDVIIESLPNSTGFYRLEDGVLTHTLEGFVLKNPDFVLEKTVMANFSVHIEYDYFGKGDCVSFSSLNDTYYIYPKNQDYSVTKFHFAVEELYKLEVERKYENKV